MPTPCYISILGQTQGLITAGAFTADSVGDIFVEGHENEMLVQEFSHVVNVPTDPQSGQPSGQRVHRPFTFTVALNKAVPLMYNALSTGEKLTNVVLKWYRTSTEGKQEQFFVTSLEGATIVNIECQMPHCQDPKQSNFTQLIKVSLAYRKINWDHLTAGTTGGDDWRKPNESLLDAVTGAAS
ncbi:Hcp family type VI secretion system effector [uncultured Shewanella sp.]|uniref:Hcp family type VI secretion system effector n=1 Tax=uncultured Shewanella sp. TaxID=173975 RepID=UPI00260BB2C6|nr:Hcp family type VI secretion system effector [uncultured Shewanella sp.]